MSPERHEERQRILADFRRWSGGFEPEECSHEEIEEYVLMSLPKEHRAELVRLWIFGPIG